ncbi:sigma-54-dependent Fis family transcriptional regulator [Paucibacter sp. O1-1]|nr:sigma-54-dependent Fis family transcriptional regulator [Paucibacter sp. O1-1]MDA3828937.1 sigma-54-dependent Fis family transcriptional regulator [Paucibacter sp. O1-1]
MADSERTLAHARALRSRGMAWMPPEGMPPATILDSWARCARAGLAIDGAPQRQVVEGMELARRREHAALVRRLAQAELETLSQQIAGSNFLLAFADRDGVILDLYADNRFAMSDADAGILAGSCWSEQLCGTNGLGTALATGAPVAVTGPEHYFLKLGDISCSAAPVRDALGEIVGVLDASSYYASRQQHTQVLVKMAATQIENSLLLQQMRSHLILALHPRAEFLATLSAGLLAFDERGRLLALNQRGAVLLSGLEARRGASFEELFGEPFDLMLARLHRQPELQLRDALGSSLVARVIARPLPQRPSSAAPSVAPAAALSRPSPAPLPEMLAEDASVAEACRVLRAAVAMRAPILIQGETGTGKELLARRAHELSGRRGEFVAVNCGALPAELFEAELFGYVGGAFTGARREGNAGLIASADGGSLLLDEVGELPLPLQAVLLRFLDDQLLRPVGGIAARKVDVQLLAASHVDLEAEVAARRFRDDLLYRLNTIKIALPPLRCRSDFALAVRGVLAGLDARAQISEAAIARLQRHGWPGNFRELRAVLTRALLHRQGQVLTPDDVAAQLPAVAGLAGSALQRHGTELVLREYERCGRSVSRTSRQLGISRTTVYRHLREAADAALFKS